MGVVGWEKGDLTPERQRNDQVVRLLSWHGHSSGGVRVPFSETMGRPMGTGTQILVTPIIRKIRKLAEDIATGRPAPRVVFLVGGPGNGKSEAVEELVRRLDDALGSQGALVDQVRERFLSGDLLPRRIEVNGAPLEPHKTGVESLIIVQDASASGAAAGDAAAELLGELDDLLTHPDPLPFYVCCVNRGILSRAVDLAGRGRSLTETEVLLSRLIRETAVGRMTDAQERSCWPMALPGHPLDGQVAVWPLDLESLLLDPDLTATSVPLLRMLDDATAVEKWEAGPCLNCSSRGMCPFLQNATWLRSAERADSLVSLLRRAELGSAKRWNFRELFSVTAEAVVGDWIDFGPARHPCDWVHGNVESTQSPSISVRTSSLLRLNQRLYSQAVFSTDRAPLPARSRRSLSNEMRAFLEAHRSRGAGPVSYIRHALRAASDLLDPALASPDDQLHPLRKIEEAYSQSVRLGGMVWRESAAVSPIEAELQRLAEEAEIGLHLLGRDSAATRDAWTYLKVYMAIVAKRSCWGETGLHAADDLLREYESAIRDSEKLRDPRRKLKELLGSDRFQYAATAAFGQVQQDESAFLTLEGPPPAMAEILPAPSPSENAPAHDFPVIVLEGRSVPLTFELFQALHLASEGCSSGSLPATVRAQLDRIRQLYAGILCRNASEFKNDRAYYRIRDHGYITLTASGDAVVFKEDR